MGKNNFGYRFELNQHYILSGKANVNESYIPSNTIYITVKYFIFSCSRANKDLNIFEYQKYWKKIYIEQKQLSVLNNKETKFIKTWSEWMPLFQNIDS